MIIIIRNSLNKGLCEIRDAERDEALRDNKAIKVYYKDEYMIITPAQLRVMVPISTTTSKLTPDKTYSIYGIKWNPEK